MDPALIGALSQLATAQYDYLKTIFTTTAGLVEKAIIVPNQLRQQAYIDRLNDALDFKDMYAGLYNEQLDTQRTLLYIMLALIGLVIVAAIFKR